MELWKTLIRGGGRDETQGEGKKINESLTSRPKEGKLVRG